MRVQAPEDPGLRPARTPRGLAAAPDLALHGGLTMSHIPLDPPPDLASAMERVLGRLKWRGLPEDHILRIHALDPDSLEHHYRLYEHAMRGRSPLSRLQREMIAVVVSASNDCFY